MGWCSIKIGFEISSGYVIIRFGLKNNDQGDAKNEKESISCVYVHSNGDGSVI